MSTKNLRNSPSGNNKSAKTRRFLFVGFSPVASLAQVGDQVGFDFADVEVKEGTTVLVTCNDSSSVPELTFKGVLISPTTSLSAANVGVVAQNVSGGPFNFPVEGLNMTVELLLA